MEKILKEAIDRAKACSNTAVIRKTIFVGPRKWQDLVSKLGVNAKAKMLTINNIFIMSKKRHLNLTLTTRHNDFSYIHSLFYKNIDKGIVFIYKYIISFLLAANTDSSIYNTGLSRKRNSIQTYQGQKTMAITFFDNLLFVNFAEILYQKLGIATAI